MGRTEPTIVKPPAAFRRDARAKRARATLNKVIPAMLSAHPRARRGVEWSELVVDPPALSVSSGEKGRGGGADAKTAGQRKKIKDHEDLSREKSASHSTTHGPPRITLCVGDALTAAQALLAQSPSSSSSEQNHNQNQKHQHQGSIGIEPPGRRYKKVGILNMASPLAPGGGFLKGATGPEASLCLRTTLLPALRDEFYRLPELGVVYTADVLVFRPTSSPSYPSAAKRTENGIETRSEAGGTVEDGTKEDDILPKNDRWFVDVASAAMLRLPETISEDENRYAYAKASDRELAQRKMRSVLRVFAARGCDAVVLGAWGCGAHEGNPVSEIAAAWRRVLGVDDHDHDQQQQQDSGDDDDEARASKDRGAGKVRGGGKDRKKKSRNKQNDREKEREPFGAYISDVVFAIQDRGTATSFARAFGENYILSSLAFLSSPSSTIDDDGEEEDPVETARVNELREKIAQLEMQVAQVRSPHLKVGLESVLAGLRRQLPPNHDGSVNDDGVSSSGRGQECSSEMDEDEDDEDNDDEEGH